MADEHWVTTEPSPKRVRALLAGHVIADSSRVLMLREAKHTPVYYFPLEDVRTDLLVPSDRRTTCPFKGEASYWSIEVDGRRVEDAVWGYEDPIAGRADIKGHVAFYWDKLDHWFEEEDEVFVHPRDPYKRVDVLQSSRHVRVVVGSRTVAESTRPILLFETGLPVRYYLPKLDVRLAQLNPTDTVTHCPYKGQARYWSVGEVEDAAWSYTHPTPEAEKIATAIAFFQERVDELWVDGARVERPRTPWSR
jgi:uncharacterized protein (DUF427 family)